MGNFKYFTIISNKIAIGLFASVILSLFLLGSNSLISEPSFDSNIPDSKRLTSQSKYLYENRSPILSLLLAIESVKQFEREKKDVSPELEPLVQKILPMIGTPIIESKEELIFNKNGSYAINYSQNGSLQLLYFGKEVKQSSPTMAHLESMLVAISPNSDYFATASGIDSVKFWDFNKFPKRPLELPLPKNANKGTNAVVTLTFTPDGNTLLAGTEQGLVYLYNLKNKKQILSLRSLNINQGMDLIVLNDNDTVVTGFWTGEVIQWSIKNNKQKPTAYSKSGSKLSKLILSSDAKWLIGLGSGFWEGTSLIWEVAKPRNPPIQLPEMYYKVSPNHRWLLGYKSGESPKVWDLEQPKKEPILVSQSIFNPEGVNFTGTIQSDGSLVVAQNNSMQLWDLKKNELKREILTEGSMQSISANPNNKDILFYSLVSVPSMDIDSKDEQKKILRNWNSESSKDQPNSLEKLISLACQKAGRNPTKDEWNEYFYINKPYVKICPDL